MEAIVNSERNKIN